MKDKARQTWSLNGKPHPATFPAAALDPDEALQAPLDADAGYDRYNDAATEHHLRTVRDLNGAIGSLASVACVFQECYDASRDGPEP